MQMIHAQNSLSHINRFFEVCDSLIEFVLSAVPMTWLIVIFRCLDFFTTHIIMSGNFLCVFAELLFVILINGGM